MCRYRRLMYTISNSGIHGQRPVKAGPVPYCFLSLFEVGSYCNAYEEWEPNNPNGHEYYIKEFSKGHKSILHRPLLSSILSLAPAIAPEKGSYFLAVWFTCLLSIATWMLWASFRIRRGATIGPKGLLRAPYGSYVGFLHLN